MQHLITMGEYLKQSSRTRAIHRGHQLQEETTKAQYMLHLLNLRLAPPLRYSSLRSLMSLSTVMRLKMTHWMQLKTVTMMSLGKKPLPMDLLLQGIPMLWTKVPTMSLILQKTYFLITHIKISVHLAFQLSRTVLELRQMIKSDSRVARIHDPTLPILIITIKTNDT